jgi:hypothetical protein
MIDDDALDVFVDKPYFVVAEAKRTAVNAQSDSQARLLAQIKSLSIQW